jgi:hypothetical protein
MVVNLAQRRDPGRLASGYRPMVAHSTDRDRHRGIAVVLAARAFGSKAFEGPACLKNVYCPVTDRRGLVLWPVLELGRRLGSREILVFFWCFIILSVNSISFDLRDIQGDLRNGTRTVPVLLGARRSTVLLGALAVLATLMSPLLGLRGAANVLLPCSLVLGAGSILLAVRSHVQPITLSFVADLFFCFPALGLWVAR